MCWVPMLMACAMTMPSDSTTCAAYRLRARGLVVAQWGRCTTRWLRAMASVVAEWKSCMYWPLVWVYSALATPAGAAWQCRRAWNWLDMTRYLYDDAWTLGLHSSNTSLRQGQELGQGLNCQTQHCRATAPKALVRPPTPTKPAPDRPCHLAALYNHAYDAEILS